MGKKGKLVRFAPGTQIGWLTVVRREGVIRGYAAWLCRCKCGNEIRVPSFWLISKRKKSCGKGHYYSEEITENFKAERRAHHNMMERCRNPRHKNYPHYGGRGIQVCERWHSFKNFREDMGKKPTPEHTIERINVNGDYEPKNCRWATMEEQRRNARNSVWVTYRGRKTLLIDVVDQLGLKREVVYGRLKMGWPLEEALSTPVRPKRPNRKKEVVLPEVAP